MTILQKIRHIILLLNDSLVLVLYQTINFAISEYQQIIENTVYLFSSFHDKFE